MVMALSSSARSRVIVAILVRGSLWYSTMSSAEGLPLCSVMCRVSLVHVRRRAEVRVVSSGSRTEVVWVRRPLDVRRDHVGQLEDPHLSGGCPGYVVVGDEDDLAWN